MYLLDTNIISELRKQKPHGAVTAWFDKALAEDIRIPAVALGELQNGVELTRRQDPQKASEIEQWIDRIVLSFAVIPMDGADFREWARLMHGKSDDLSADAMIAATARIHGMVVVSRNVKDFARFGVQVFNPFSGKSV
jgi:hypothetical protein